ncbi:MAG: ATPase domain-containing protein [Bdellovibrionota bacterium]
MTNKQLNRCSTGTPGLDEVLRGGLPRERMYLLRGEPGTGKTTLALKFLLEGVKQGEKCLYITFSETRDELEATAESHGWSLHGLELFELTALEHKLRPDAQSTIFHPSEIELAETTQVITSEVERIRPSRIVFDSASEMRLMAETSLRYRRQLLALKQYFSGRKCTVLFLDDLTASGEGFQIESIVHGVIELVKNQSAYGMDQRQLRVEKLRGVAFFEGGHDCMIRTGGMAVFPRLMASHEQKKFEKESIASDVDGLDELLGGGIDRGTSTLLLGPAGSGKSTITLQFAHAAARRGDKVAIFSFEESANSIISRTAAFNLDFESLVERGTVAVRKISPAEVSPGEFADDVRSLVDKENVKLVVIDSLTGYLHAMPEQKYLILQMHELLAHLNQRGVATIAVLTQSGMMGQMHSQVDLTYLADTVLITRFFEYRGSVKNAVSVVKKRTGAHEKTIREFVIDSHGLHVGQALDEFQGVLTGVPRYVGKSAAMLKRGASQATGNR